MRGLPLGSLTRCRMKQLLTMALILTSITLAACAKKAEQTASTPATPPPAQQSAPSAAPTESSQDEAERAKKQTLMDYATMEDQYINDPRAQWANSAKASSTFGDDGGAKPSEVSVASNVIGTVDGKTWTNNHQDVGFDWLQVGFTKPVAATEVRIVFQSGEGVEAVSKLELADEQGNWTTVWSGLSATKADSRGNRTWFVQKFDKTAFKANAAKITLANNVQRGYKVIDAFQLVGD